MPVAALVALWWAEALITRLAMLLWPSVLGMWCAPVRSLRGASQVLQCSDWVRLQLLYSSL